MAVLHAQLFDLQPGLAFLPLFVIGLVAHFSIRATRATDKSRSDGAAETGLSQVRPLLPQDDAKLVQDDSHSHSDAVLVPLRPPSASLNHDHLNQNLVDLENDISNLPDSSSNYSSPLDDDCQDGGDSELDPNIFLEFQIQQNDEEVEEDDFFPLHYYRAEGEGKGDEEDDHIVMYSDPRSASPVLENWSNPNPNPVDDRGSDSPSWRSSSDYSSISGVELQVEGSEYDDL